MALRRCWVLGTGPSIRDFDFSSLDGEVTIGVSGIVELFTPDFLCIADDLSFKMYSSLFDKCHDSVLVTTDDVTIVHGDLSVIKSMEPSILDTKAFDADFDIAYWAQSTTFDLAVPLAIHLGFKTIYLLGVDGTDDGHASAVEPWDKTSGHCAKRKSEYLEAVRCACDKAGVRVINMSPDSKVIQFETGSL